MSGTLQGPAAARKIELKILENSFAPWMRDLRIDAGEYARLCEALRELARDWRGCDLVDREVAGALQAILATTRDMIPTLSRATPGLRDELEDMGNTLGRLIRDCFERGP